MNKKVFTVLVVLFLSFFTITSALAYNSNFKDVKQSDWFHKYVTFLSENGIMSGDKNGYFKPNSQITKAELSRTLFNYNTYVSKNLSNSNSQMITHINTRLKQEKQSTLSEVSKMIDSKLTELENEEQKTINLFTESIPSVVYIDMGSQFGTGFFINGNQILTNYHVVKEATNAKVSTVTGQEYTAKVVKRDINKDLALLELSGKNDFRFLEFTDSKTIGQNVLILGHPEDLSFAASKGIVSKINMSDMNGYKNLIQVDAAINHGNSGSPVIDSKGKVIGIVVSKYTGEEISNIGFCISYSTIQEFLLN